MPGIVALVTALSLDVTRGLVAAGYGLGFDGQRYVFGAPPLQIVGASNTTPIVIETSQPHLVSPEISIGGASVVISGVLGNTAANHVSTESRDYTNGQNLGVLAVPIDETHLALYAGYDGNGALVPLVGNGAYTDGGTVLPALTDLSVLMDRSNVSEMSAPPRIVAVPIRSKWGAKSTALPSGSRITERDAERLRRAIRSEQILFEIHTWGQAIPPHPARDFDATQLIYQQVIQSANIIAAGAFELIDGAWTDQQAGMTQLIKAGHEHVFGLGFCTPVLDQAFPFVPTDTVFVPTTRLQPPDGSPAEVGCSG